MRPENRPETGSPAVTVPAPARTETRDEAAGNPARAVVHSGSPVCAWKAATVMPNPTAATSLPAAAYASPWLGTVPPIPSLATHVPGSSLVHRIVPAKPQCPLQRDDGSPRA